MKTCIKKSAKPAAVPTTKLTTTRRAKLSEAFAPPTRGDYQLLRLYGRTRLTFMAARIGADNQGGRKANGKKQNIAERYNGADVANLLEIADTARAQEDHIEKLIEESLTRFPIYTRFLSTIPGLGTIAACNLLGSIRIDKADTVSKITQYAGLNPGMVMGKRRVNTDKPKKYKPEPGEQVEFVGDSYVIVKTNYPVRGDKLTKDFLPPYNIELRKALCGVMAGSFLKASQRIGPKIEGVKSEYRQVNRYALEVYYPEKHRLENSQQQTHEMLKGGKIIDLAWQDCKKGHIHRAAIRKMIKRFLCDFYVAWRTLEGLPVREPYQQQYLGHNHSGHQLIYTLDGAPVDKTNLVEVDVDVDGACSGEIADDDVD